jgi:ClpP class serine protease
MDWTRWLTTQLLGIDPAFAGELLAAIRAAGGQPPQLFGAELARPRDLTLGEPQIVDGVAYEHLVGLLTESMSWPGFATSYADFSRALQTARDASAAQEIVILCNSPGGTVAGAAECRNLVAAVAGVKRCTAIAVNGLMASAAYWVCSAASRIEATVGARIGSIGVLFLHMESSKADAAEGYTYTLLRRPAAKATGNSYEPLTEEAAASLMRTSIDPTYELMRDQIAAGRRVSAETVERDFGAGLVLPAEQALAAGMIDGIHATWPAAPGAGRQSLGTSQASEQITREQQGGPPGPGGAEDNRRSPASHTFQGAKIVKYSQKLRAFLYANDLIPAMDAADEVIAAGIAGFFRARGQAVPETEEAIRAGLETPLPKAAAESVPPASGTPGPGVNHSPPAAGFSAADLQQALAGERQRCAAIRQRAELLGLAGDAAEVIAAIDSGVTPDGFAAGVVNAAVAGNKPLSVAPRGDLVPGQSQLERFSQAAVHALLLRSDKSLMGMATGGGFMTAGQAREKVNKLVADNPTIREVAAMPWLQIMRAAVDSAGIRTTDKSDTAYAQAFIRMQGQEERLFAQGHPRLDPYGLQASSGPMVGPGDYPGIMDGVMGKVVEYALSVADVTYDQWTSRLPDAQNFQPEEIRELGYRGAIPEHIDGTGYDQSGVVAKTLAFLQVAEYGREFCLSWRTMLSDPMDMLIQGIGQDQIGHERTLNQLCFDLLMGNVTSPIDSLACYDASHTNDIGSGSGGAPSLTQAKAMRKLHQKQKLTTDSTREAGLDMAIALVGSEWWTDAQQTFLDVTRLNHLPIDQTYINPLRGVVTPLYDPILSGGTNSGKMWYTTTNPNGFVKGIRHRFLAGFGPGGRRDAYYDPSKICQWYRIRGCFAALLHHHECFVRNYGS